MKRALAPHAVCVLDSLDPAAGAPNRAEFEVLSSAAEILGAAPLTKYMNFENGRLRQGLLNFASSVWEEALRADICDGTVAICTRGVFLSATARYAALALGAQPDSLIRESLGGFVLDAPPGAPAPDAAGPRWTAARLVVEA